MRKQNPKQCPHCKKYFKSGAGLALHLRRLESPKEPKETIRCARKGCNKTYKITPKSRKYRKYCSKSCLAKAQKGKRPPMSDKQRKQISDSKKQRYIDDPTVNPFYGRTPTNYQGWGHGQFVKDLGYWVRSTWERDYLLALKSARIEFEYEAKRFDLDGKGTYCPDIRLGNKDIYIEITGWDKPGKAEKREMFKEIYNIPLYVWDKRPTEAHIAEFVAMCEGAIRAE